MAEGDLVGSVVVGRYKVIERIATGAAADIYEAEHVELGTHVALKVLASDDVSSEAAARFLREGKTLGMFRHRNIVELLEVGRLDDGRLFLATELVRGASLRSRMGMGPMDARRALDIVRQLLDALGHAHAMGVVHRDVRPENIMLAVAPEGGDLVKVLDFGVAKLAVDTAAVLGESKLTKTGFNTFGDARYIAPERITGTAIDGRADLYSAGVVLYELLAGQPPFDDPDPAALLRLHGYAPAPALAIRAPARTFTPELELIVSEALQKKPDLRFQSAGEMQSAIDVAVNALAEAAALAAPPAVAPGDRSDPAFAELAQSFMPASAQALATAETERWAGTPALTESESSRPPPGAVQAPSRSAAQRGRDLIVLAKQHRYIVAGAGGALLLLIILIATRGSSGSGKHHVLGRDPAQAKSVLEAGHKKFAAGQRADALASYEQAISLDGSIASDATVKANAASIADGKDAVAAVIALELLATRLSPPAREVVALEAANGKLPEIRNRARAIAERDGFTDQIDPVVSLSLDLAQATTCEERRAVIGKLRATADKRAVPPLKKAKVYKCVERDATDAISELESKP